MRNLDNPIEFARHRRRSATSGEFLMWQIVRDRQRCKMKFRREHPVGPYTCDFYCAEAKLDIECDGKDHFTEEGRARDAVRDAWMKRQGITTLRFTNQQVENDTQTVMKIIDGKLLELTSPSPPAPLPEDGERGASPIEGSVREDRPSLLCPLEGTIREDGGSREGSMNVPTREDGANVTLRSDVREGVLLSPNPVFAESDVRDDVLSPPRPVFGERGLGGEGHNVCPFLSTAFRGLNDVSSIENAVDLNVTKPNAFGFTLIELLVTLVIVSVLAAATLPAFKNVIVERKTSVAALEVKAFLDAARARAIARGRPVSVILERLSSRTEGLVVGTIVQSSTAKNLPIGPEDNFDVYNTCIRMVMAESMRPITFELAGFAEPNDLTNQLPEVRDNTTNAVIAPMVNPLTLPPSYTLLSFLDGNDLPAVTFNNATPMVRPRPEPGRILRIPNTDSRMSNLLLAGNEISLYKNGDSVGRFVITAPLLPAEHSGVPGGTNLAIAIRNHGDGQAPWGSPNDVTKNAASQSYVTQYRNVTTFDSFSIDVLPRPLASMVMELPRGSSIDLSLSGFASDDPNENPPPVTLPPTLPPVSWHYHDCRREFSSDWILPPVNATGATVTPNVPVPSDLRPVYLTFSSNGLLTSVLTNGPGVPTLRRVEPQSDVCLFVGRNDQVIRTVNTVDLDAADNASLKPNLMDPTGYWVRISPSSGIISAAPAQASHIIEDLAGFRGGNPAEQIGHLLEDSRSLVFDTELTSQ